MDIIIYLLFFLYCRKNSIHKTISIKCMQRGIYKIKIKPNIANTNYI